MPSTFQADKAAGVDVVFQFRISGSGGGDWYAVVKDKTCTVEAGLHPKPTTTLKMAGEDFLKLRCRSTARDAGLHERQTQDRGRPDEIAIGDQAVQILKRET